MTLKDQQQHWEMTPKFIKEYKSPSDRKIFCDIPLINLLGDVSQKDILDLGCANGHFTNLIAKKGAKKVVGVDVSEGALEEARSLFANRPNLSFQREFAEKLSFPDSSYNIVVGSMLINTISQKEMVKAIFEESHRVLTSDGKMVISMAHPSHLDEKSSFRKTIWKENQSQETLEPGEEVVRQFAGGNGSMITVKNYYWPIDFLAEIAENAGFESAGILEPIATKDDIVKHPELNSTVKDKNFFLIMAFNKK